MTVDAGTQPQHIRTWFVVWNWSLFTMEHTRQTTDMLRLSISWKSYGDILIILIAACVTVGKSQPWPKDASFAKDNPGIKPWRFWRPNRESVNQSLNRSLLTSDYLTVVVLYKSVIIRGFQMFNLAPHLLRFFTVLPHESFVFFDLVVFCLQPASDVSLCSTTHFITSHTLITSSSNSIIKGK